jgi:hypothetical protein
MVDPVSLTAVLDGLLAGATGAPWSGGGSAPPVMPSAVRSSAVRPRRPTRKPPSGRIAEAGIGDNPSCRLRHARPVGCGPRCGMAWVCRKVLSAGGVAWRSTPGKERTF